MLENVLLGYPRALIDLYSCMKCVLSFLLCHSVVRIQSIDQGHLEIKPFPSHSRIALFSSLVGMLSWFQPCAQAVDRGRCLIPCLMFSELVEPD